ncbi:MAG: efflux RND transporter permease subunit [Methylobacter sp.]|nr:efflux RND transporter permease subunit [Methylobacter sp.]
MSRFNLSAFAVKERAITLFLIIAITGAGIYAFLNLGRAEDPPFTIKQIVISAAWPGATAQEMQDLVAEPYEKRLQELRWYDRIETMTRPGLALMTLTLKDNIPPGEVPEQFYQARKKLGDEAHKLPQGTLGPFINDEYSDVTFALYALQADGLPLPLLTREAENIRQKLLHVPGVKKVDLFGERPERIFVEISNERLANLGVNAHQILDALHKQNALTPAGSIETSGPQMFVRLDGAYDSLDKIRNTPIVAAGQSFKLSDIAEVKRGYEDPATFFIRHDGKPALVLGLVMQEGWNGLKLGETLDAEEKKISRELALGYQLKKITDQSVNIAESVNEFSFKFFVALGVVVLVSLLSMGWRVGIVVAAAVPLTLAAVLVVMMITDRMFDRITLGALIISLGLLVDDAIIAVEIMVVKMEEGVDRIKAAAYAWSNTAAPMLTGTLVTVIGFTPVGFAKSTAGEYAGNIFWIVGFALLTSWFVAVFFTPYLGVKLLPDIKPVEGGHQAIYSTPNYRRFRALVTWSVVNKKKVATAVLLSFFAAVAGMGSMKQQFFPSSDRPEMLVEIQMPYGTSIEATSAAAAKVEHWLKQQPESKVVTSYIGQGAPRFFLAFSPELPDPSFAKIIVLTPDQETRETLKSRLRESVQNGLAPEAKVRATQLVFGPPSPFPVAFRVMGSDPDKVRAISNEVADLMRKTPNMRQVNQDWGNLQPTLHFVLDQERLKLIGMAPNDVAEQLQFLLTGVPVTQVRENIRTVDIIARSAGGQRLDPARIADFNLTNRDGKTIPLRQVGRIEFQPEEPLMRRRDRFVTITVRGDIDETLQPPQVSMEIRQALEPIIQALPAGYKIEMAGSIEEAEKANKALLPIFPIMLILILTAIIFQVRSFSAMTMVFLTGPLGLVGTVPILLLFHQPFGFNAILGLIGLSGILMRNTLILIDQIKHNEDKGLDTFNAVVEATVQRARPVVLTALAAILAFIPLTHSVFWGSMAYTLIGGTAVGTILTLVFLPTLYAIWFKVKST